MIPFWSDSGGVPQAEADLKIHNSHDYCVYPKRPAGTDHAGRRSGQAQLNRNDSNSEGVWSMKAGGKPFEEAARDVLQGRKYSWFRECRACAAQARPRLCFSRALL